MRNNGPRVNARQVASTPVMKRLTPNAQEWLAGRVAPGPAPSAGGGLTGGGPSAVGGGELRRLEPNHGFLLPWPTCQINRRASELTTTVTRNSTRPSSIRAEMLRASVALLSWLAILLEIESPRAKGEKSITG